MATILNTASVLLNKSNDTPDKRTFIVLGSPRGGTSMTAGMLRIAGVNMGDNIDEDNNEDQDFLFHKGNYAGLSKARAPKGFLPQVKSLIKGNNEKYDIWGWKDPLCSLYIDKVIGELVNPHFLIVTRDISAIAMRERATRKNTLSANDTISKFTIRKLQMAHDLYARAIAFTEANEYPTMLISYERSLRYKERLGSSVLDFVRPDLSSSERKELIGKITNYISPDKGSGSIANLKSEVKKSRTAKKESFDFLRHLGTVESIAHLHNKAASFVNNQEYDDCLEVIECFDYVHLNGASKIENFDTSLSELKDFFTSSRFIKAIALVNTGKVNEAINELSIYVGLMELAKQSGQELEVATRVKEPAMDLLEKLLSQL